MIRFSMSSEDNMEKNAVEKRVSNGGKPPTLKSSRVEKLKKGNCGAGIVRLALRRQKCVEGV